ncbi:hypothetical protein OIDMADRAFT_20017 [Oidiodendron maius Zn]|uniref:Uncharacterized protein n=1 Tax=Oidiodendron maius (strain Zn) TaxID=913774 RepID=A0A0C3H7T4_OIDMZ|nr:hypothetical protein OIDMADRAFT_20017 [Oidiodendron maius Zn]
MVVQNYATSTNASKTMWLCTTHPENTAIPTATWPSPGTIISWAISMASTKY